MKKKNSGSKMLKKLSKRKMLLLLAIVSFAIGILLSLSENYRLTARAVDQGLAQPQQPGVFVIFGTKGVTGDSLQQGWKNGSLFNGVNTWNIIDKEQFYAGNQSLSWAPAAPFERGWIVAPAPFDISQYKYLNFYGRSTEAGQRLEVGFSDATGNLIGNFVPFDGMGPPLQPDRWQLYSAPISQFNVTGPVSGLVFRDMNGAPQKKIYMDEIELSINPGTAPLISAGLGQPGTPTEPPKPKGPFYPKISPWVYIIPGLIIMLAIFFE